MVKVRPLSQSVSASCPLGSAGLSHAYIQYPPIRCNMSGTGGLTFDDGNRLLLALAPGKVFSWSVNEQSPRDDPPVTNFAEGPVLFVRFSLDGAILAVQRSGQEVEFIHKETGEAFSQRCKQGTDQILGLFWTDCPFCDMVFITNSGLELYALNQGRTGLKLIDIKRLNVSWYAYTHESRLVLLASGMQCKTLAGYQFSAGGIIQLPKFDVGMAKAEVNSKPVLASQDVHIVTMYGRLYCLQVDRVAMQLNLYQFYRDAVVAQGFLPIYSSNVSLSVVDNVLLIHEIDSKVVLLYDILSDSKVPISAPLPLLFRGAISNSSSLRSNESVPSYSNSSTEIDHLENIVSAECLPLYEPGWVFEKRDIVLDHAHGLLWRIKLDLEAIAASSSDMPSLLAFLQRRSQEGSKAKLLSMEVVRSMILERQPLQLIARAMDVLTSSYGRAVKLTTGYDRGMVTKCDQSTSSRATATFQPSNIPDSPVEISPDTAQAIEDTLVNRIEAPVNVTKVNAGAQRQVHNRLDNDDGHVNSKVSENLVQDSPTADGQHHEVKQDKSKVGSGNSEAEIVSSSAFPDPDKTSERAWQQSHVEILVTEFGEFKGANSALISPEEMHYHVFNTIEEDMTSDTTFLIAAMIEYLHSAAAEQVRVNPGLHILLIQLLAQQQQHYELWQLIVSKVVPPSKAVALELLEVGKHDTSTRKLGMDMLRQIHAHNDYVNLLLQEGSILEGLSYVRRSKVKRVPPGSFLQDAMALMKPQKLACVFRFCLDSIPNFRLTSDFSVYRQHVSRGVSRC